MYYDNAIPGTNVKIAINPQKFKDQDEKSRYIYYDPKFDSGDEIDMLFSEISKACEDKIKESRIDYFNIYFHPLIIEKDGRKIETSKNRCIRRSYIYPGVKGKFGQDIRYFPYKPSDAYCFNDNMAYFWDKEFCRAYRLMIRPCTIEEKEGKKQLVLPEKIPNLYNISYKFNSISKADSVYIKHDFMKPGIAKRFHAGFIKVDVLILDDEPGRYMNIDRERLREDAIDEEELLAVRNEILRHWCDFFCNADSEKEQKTKAKDKTENLRNRFQKKPGILFSLILLFYQNIPKSSFEKFFNTYKGFLDSMNITLADENIDVGELLKPDNLFKTELPLPAGFAGMSSTAEECDAIPIHINRIVRFPHRLINIKCIQKEKDGLSYYLRLQAPGDEVRAIDMDDSARLYDYINAFDLSENQTIIYDSIQKKAFKPDSAYMNLLVPCLPHTFYKGRNMQSDMDYCIEWYILSPFDANSIKTLSKGITNGTDIQHGLANAVLNGEQLKKCVSYIIKKRFADYHDKESIKQDIENEYRKFVVHFIQLLLNYPSLKELLGKKN